MRLNASVGRAAQTVSLKDEVCKLTITAQSRGERKWMAGLFKALVKVADWRTRLRDEVPNIQITEREKENDNDRT